MTDSCLVVSSQTRISSLSFVANIFGVKSRSGVFARLLVNIGHRPIGFASLVRLSGIGNVCNDGFQHV